MNLLLAIALFSGSPCSGNSCVNVHRATLPVYAAPVVYPDPYWYVAGQQNATEQRLRKLEEIADKQVQILEYMKSGSPAGMVTSQVEQNARAVLQRSCVKCHTGDNPKGGVALDGELSTAEKLLVANVVQSGEMPPPPAKELSDEDYASLQAWANEDRAAVRELLRSAK